ncbi:MAG TPA: NAD(P)/FAD-dependent oxidoreductase [Methanospirillum sp.]|nr:NAD(P)/FAD-dependent oxidoreductase [Methanospirillum sp.]
MDQGWDVVVVGAGPAGSAAAADCASAGLSTLLIEEQAHIGFPVQCAGLLSCSAFSECRVTNRSVLNTVSGAVVSAGSASCSFDAGQIKAYVVDRGMLDQEMGWTAANAGAEIQLKTGAHSVDIRNKVLKTRGVAGIQEIRYRVLIAADGPRSTISRAAGLDRAPVYLSGLQCDIPYDMEQQKVAIFPNASPEFFGWVIPMGKGRARIGMCGISGVRELFERFIRPFGRSGVHYVSGTIPIGTLPKTFSDGLMVVGDAAALAKPTSGGGVYTGIRSARHAAAVAIQSCEEDRTDASFLSTYEKRWKKDFGRELKIGYTAFGVRQKISPTKMESLIREMSRPSIQDLIVRKGDMDRPGRLIASLLVHPRMMIAGGSLLSGIIRSFAD